MARVYLTSTNSAAIDGEWRTSLWRLKQSSLASTVRMHYAVASPEDADIILFSDPFSNIQADVRNHALTKQFSEKVFVYSTKDRAVPFVPGVYTSAEKRWYQSSHMRSGFYIKVIDHDWIQPSPINERPLYLFSFCGSFETHPLRRRIARLGNAHGFVRDTSKHEGRVHGQTHGANAQGDFGKSAREFRAEYSRVMYDSIFVLCPRGVAPSSYRIFEAMKAGRVPVILSDEWVPPNGPNWTEFSLRVPEARLQDVPQILERLVSRAPEMGLRASQAWERWFSKEQAFQTIVTWCIQILETSQNQELFQRYRPIVQLARPYFFRHVILRAAKNRLLRRLEGA